MIPRRVVTLLLFLALAAINAWAAISITSGPPPSPVVINQTYNFTFTSSTAANWAIVTGNPPPGINLSTGGVLSGAATQAGTFGFTVKATNVSDSADTATAQFSIVVNNGLPTINGSSFNPNATVGTAYSNQMTATGGFPPYSWSLQSSIATNNGITITTAGLLQGTPTTAGNTNLIIQVRDSQGNAAQGTFVLVVTGAFTVTTTSLPNGNVNIAYTATLQASGGTAPLTWAVTGTGVLPPGLTLNTATGVISGTPTTNGTYAFSVTVTDASNLTASANLTILIGGVTITTSSLPNATVGVSYSQTLAATGGTPPYTWSATGLPSGLSVTASSGVISGTPGSAGAFTVAVTVTDSVGSTSTTNLSLTVVTSPFRITTTSPLPTGTAGIPYSQQLFTTGGTAPYQWSATGLPTGLSIDNTGTITGSPASAGTTSFNVTAVDSGGLVANASFSITINSPVLTITDFTANCYTANNHRPFPDPEFPGATTCPRNAQYTATGNTGGVSFTANNLPAGMTLGGSGILSGTPTSAGTFNFSVIGTDSQRNQGILNTSITVGTIAPPTTNDITVGGINAPGTLTSGQQQLVVLSVSGTTKVNIIGTLTLAFASSVGGDDQLLRLSNNDRKVGYSISPTAGGRATFNSGTLAVLTGTVAGTITLTATFTDNYGNDLTPTSLKNAVYTINATAPVVFAPIFSNDSSCAAPTCYIVSVTGYSNARDMASAVYHFVPTTNTTISNADVTVQFGNAFTNYYALTSTNAFGGQFTVKIPFTFTQSTGPISGAPISSLTVNFTNSKGASLTSPSGHP